MPRRALASVNLAAIERNVRRLRDAAPDAALCAVVKADGYGHGAVPVARAAQAAGAAWLAVAAASEATALRAAGIDGPILVLGALGEEELHEAVAADADVVVWREDMVAAVDGLRAAPVRVHVKYDTGMGRLGTRDPDEAQRVLEAALEAPGVRLVGAMTHFATADEPGEGFFDEQLGRFSAWVHDVCAHVPDIVVHAANSAATLRDAASHFDMVRPGVAIYGLDPHGEDPARYGLEPALALTSYVAEVKRAASGESVGYGRRFVASRDTDIATVPIGYGDGWSRSLTNRADALVRGRRRPMAGTVSMDNLTLSLGADDHGVQRGDGVVLIGAEGDERILAEDVARHAQTINYEITCGLTARVPRAYHRDGVLAA